MRYKFNRIRWSDGTTDFGKHKYFKWVLTSFRNAFKHYKKRRYTIRGLKKRG